MPAARSRWLHVMDTADGWVVRRERGPVLAEFERWADAIAVARLITREEGGDFVVRGADRIGETSLLQAG